MKKIIFLLVFLSSNVFSQSNLYVTSAGDWDFYFRPGVGGNHVWKNNDGTLAALVLAKGKGTSFGEEGIWGVDANCRNGEVNRGKGWQKPSSGSALEAIWKKMCSYTSK